MADILARIRLRRATLAQWSSINPILALGEPAYETDTGTLRIGDGVTQFLSLPQHTNTANLQAKTAPLTKILELGTVAGKFLYTDGAFSWKEADITSLARNFMAKETDAEVRTVIKAVGLENDEEITGKKTFNKATLGNISTVAPADIITLNISTANRFKVTLDRDVLFANPLDMPAVGQSFMIVLKQDGTGGRLAAWGSYFKFPYATAPILTPTAGATDIVLCEVISATEILCNAVADLG